MSQSNQVVVVVVSKKKMLINYNTEHNNTKKPQNHLAPVATKKGDQVKQAP